MLQYFVKDYQLSHLSHKDNIDGLKIEIVFGRKILSELLTTHIPTMLICMVSISTNFYKHVLFKGQVTVNLTCMLVLTTLFISISGTLPRTSYIKMVE